MVNLIWKKQRWLSLLMINAMLQTFAAAETMAQSTPVGVTIKSQWKGTAPICNATANDCPEDSGVVATSDYGDGAYCMTGEKVQCAIIPRSGDLKPKKWDLEEYFTFKWVSTKQLQEKCTAVGGFSFGLENGRIRCGIPKFVNLTWLGTAPLCDPSPTDCTRNGGQIVDWDSLGDGERCLSGGKQLCRSTKYVKKDVISARREWHTSEECPLKYMLGDNYLKSIPVDIKNGLIIDRRTNAPYSSLKINDNKTLSAICGTDPKTKKQIEIETLYAVAPDNKLHLVNVCTQPSRKMPVLGADGKTYTAAKVMAPECASGRGKDEQVVHSLIIGKYSDTNKRTVSGEVLGAGMIDIKNGKIVKIDNCSGHYQPDLKMLLQTMQILAEQGVSVPEFANCSPN